VYDPVIDGKRLTFGVSGKLYKAALVMYDRQTESLWSQLLQEAITGPMTGARLKVLPSLHTRWEYWRAQYPETLVLSPDTGFQRDYGLNPYQEYWERGQPPPFRRPPKQKPSVALRPMERVLGVSVNGIRKAYPFSVLKKKPQRFEDRIGGKKVLIHFDKKSETAYITDESGAIVPSITLFWFAWSDFYPETEVFGDEQGERGRGSRNQDC
jgi:hypothetical protein